MESILKELEILSGFVIGEDNLADIKYGEDTELTVDTNRKV